MPSVALEANLSLVIIASLFLLSSAKITRPCGGSFLLARLKMNTALGKGVNPEVHWLRVTLWTL